MVVFTVIVGVLSTAAAVGAVWFAWRAAQSSAEAAALAKNALDVARQTGGAVAEHTQSTVETLRYSRESDNYYRRAQQLAEIASLVERVLREAPGPASGEGYWRGAEQAVLGPLLVGIRPPLVKCTALVSETRGRRVREAAQDAQGEITARLMDLHGGAAFNDVHFII